MKTASVCLGLIAIMTPAFVWAQDGSNSVGLGFAIVPDYDGSADYVVRPSIRGQLTFGDVSISLRGTGVSADLISGPVGAGPILNYRFGRNDSVENPQVAALPEIDDAIEIGAFSPCPWAAHLPFRPRFLRMLRTVTEG
jgi:MipA family protein